MKESKITQKMTCLKCFRRSVAKIVTISNTGVTTEIKVCSEEECGHQNSAEDYHFNKKIH